ncbi:MAG: hypothetical protein NVS3B21_17010 [Acidimicrobiales bacterium]
MPEGSNGGWQRRGSDEGTRDEALRAGDGIEVGGGSGSGAREDAHTANCRFRLAPPRHFPYPAILLLLLEEPRHGYRLVDSLLRFGFGPIDRPTVYRTLADLEHDGLVTSWMAAPSAGSTRQVYGVTEQGRSTLDTWMSTLACERDSIGEMIDRYEKRCPKGGPR